MELDPLYTTVAGSRRPVVLPTVKQVTSSSSTAIIDRDIVLEESQAHLPVSRIRRKPRHTYKSPVARELVNLRVEGHARLSPTAPSPVLAQSVSESGSSVPSRPLLQHLTPPLPLYHPLGILAQSAPVLDPVIFGHSGAVSLNVDDYAQLDADAIRRLSSRARRPAAKVRERDAAEEESSTVLEDAGTNEANAITSPKKRRTGAGVGSRRRRRDVNGDGTYPNPPKRTRNARNNAFASPLAGTVITNEDDMPDTAEQTHFDRPSAAPDGEDVRGPKTAADELEVQEQRRSTRSRRVRPLPSKRRHSSASETTTTSVSVSIATNSRNMRSTGAEAQQETVPPDEAQPDVEMKETEDAEEHVGHAGAHAEPASSAERPIDTRTDEAQAQPEPAPMDDIVDATVTQRGPHEINDRLARAPSVVSAEEAKKESPPPLHSQQSEPQPGTVDQAAVQEVPRPPAEPQTKPGIATTRPDPLKSPDNVRDRYVAELVDKPHTLPPFSLAVSVVPEKPILREPPIPDKPKMALSQKISPSTWTRFAPAAGSAGSNAGQRKVRDEEKEEGELSEESNDTPPRGR